MLLDAPLKPLLDPLRSLAARVARTPLITRLTLPPALPPVPPEALAAPVPVAPLRYLVPGGGLAVDVGAHLGGVTRVLAALVGPAGEVAALEPHPRSFEVLRANVRRLGLQQVRPLALAATHADGPATLRVPRTPAGGEALTRARLGSAFDAAADAGYAVAGRALDGLFAERRPGVDFVHVDAPGHELRILRGSAEILRNHRPAFWFRLAGEPLDELGTPRAVVQLLTARGYTPYQWDGARLRAWEPTAAGSGWFFLTMRQAGRLPREMLA